MENCELLDLVKRRRSIRRYEPREVPVELVRELLQAASFAPSPHNRQPWRFAVLTERTAKDRLAAAMGDRLRHDRMRDGDPPEAIEADVARSRARIGSAPVVLVAALTMADMDPYADELRGRAERLMAVQATAAAIQNILLLAEARGLGACWMCAPLFCPGAVRAALDLRPDWEPQALVTLGFPAAAGRERPRKALSDTVRWFV